jgi:hypothetical protein
VLDRIAVRSRRDRRKGERRGAELRRNLHGAPVAGAEQLRLVGVSAAPDRADGMDDVAGRQVPACRRLRVARLAAAEATALLEDRRAAGAVDRAVDATAAEQCRVGRVHDRVDLLLREVADDELNHAAAGSGISPWLKPLAR